LRRGITLLGTRNHFNFLSNAEKKLPDGIKQQSRMNSRIIADNNSRISHPHQHVCPGSWAGPAQVLSKLEQELSKLEQELSRLEQIQSRPEPGHRAHSSCADTQQGCAWHATGTDTGAKQSLAGSHAGWLLLASKKTDSPALPLPPCQPLHMERIDLLSQQDDVFVEGSNHFFGPFEACIRTITGLQDILSLFVEELDLRH
jgi:hypothetical protein